MRARSDSVDPRRPPALRIALSAILALAGGREARAEPAGDGSTPAADSPMPVAFGADQVHVDAKSQALDASGHVHVDEPPFHLTSDALQLRRVPIGVDVEGPGALAFCPCLGTPLAVRFRRATLAPPHDLVLRDPVLEVFGVPVAWAPLIWLRSPGRVGLLPPDVAWRGGDGLLLGEGIHLPWQSGDLVRGLDLRAGGYVDGGANVQAFLRTTTTESRLAWDWWRGDAGVTLVLRGATAIAGGVRPDAVAWEVDAMRGARAVRATSDVALAAFPFDHAVAEAAWHDDGWTFASAVRAYADRGGGLLDLGAGGPVVFARRSGALASAGAYDATLEGGAIDGAGLGATTFARAEGGGQLAARTGPIGEQFAVRTEGDIAKDANTTALDGGGQARLSAGLPLARAFRSADADDPWVHRTEPRITGAALFAHLADSPLIPIGRGATAGNGGAWVATAEFANSLGRWGSTAAAEVDLSGGVVGGSDRVLPAGRGRASVEGPWLGLEATSARVFGAGPDRGGAFVGRLRAGPASGLHLTTHVAERDGVDPIVARTLADAPLEPASGFLASPGWTGGGSATLPLGSRVTVHGGAEVDLDAGELVAALGAIELHDPCSCVVVRGTASQRIGRPGVDVWLSIDLPTPP